MHHPNSTVETVNYIENWPAWLEQSETRKWLGLPYLESWALWSASCIDSPQHPMTHQTAWGSTTGWDEQLQENGLILDTNSLAIYSECSVGCQIVTCIRFPLPGASKNDIIIHESKSSWTAEGGVGASNTVERHRMTIQGKREIPFAVQWLYM